MAEDWLISRFDEVERAALLASEELATVPDGLTQARRDRAAGMPLPDLARKLAASGAPGRRRVAAACHRYQQAVARLRSDVVRALVDQEGVSLSVLAREMGVSRQSVTRLYEARRDPPEST